MVVRDERAAGAAPGPPSTGAPTGAIGRRLGRIQFLLRSRWVIVPLSVCCVVLLLMTGLPSTASWHDQSGGLQLASGSLPGTTDTFYPYLASASAYPGIGTLSASTVCSQVSCGASGGAPFNLSYPQVVTVLVGGVPTIYLLGVTQVAGGTYKGSSVPVLITGAYSPTLAKGILNGSSKANVPVSWNSYSITLSTPEISMLKNLGGPVITGDSLAASPNGTDVFVALVMSGTTTLLASFNDGLSWAPVDGTVTGIDPHLSLGGSSVLLATQATSEVVATTYYLAGASYSALNFSEEMNATSRTLSVNPENVAVTWLPSPAMGREVILATTTSDLIEEYTSVDGGHIFAGLTIGNFTPSTNTSALNSVGATRIWNPGGIPGQLSVASDGTTLFVIYTTDPNGIVSAATMSSYNNGTTWDGPYITSTQNGAVFDPEVQSSPAGYFYAVWEENSLRNWSLDLAVFAASAITIQAPGILPGSANSQNLSQYYPALAVDPFQRPFAVWVGLNHNLNAALNFTGLYPSPGTALAILRASVGELQGWDFRSGQASGTNGTLSTLVDNRISWAQANASAYAAHPSTLSYFCALQNVTADRIYPNVSHVQLQYSAGPSVCGNLAPGVSDTNSSGPSGIPRTPANYYWSPSVGMSLGPDAANSFLTVETDWALESEGIPVTWSSDPLRALDPTSSVLPPLPVSFPGSVTTSGKTWTVTVTVQPQNPTMALLNTTSISVPTYGTSWDGTDVSCDGVEEPILYSETTKPVVFYSNVSAEGGATQVASSTSGLPSFYLTNLTSNATAAWAGTFSVTLEGVLEEYKCGDLVLPIEYPEPPGHGLPGSLAVSLSGTATTTLAMVPNPPSMLVIGSDKYVNYEWNNTMPATAVAQTTNLSGNFHTSKGQFPSLSSWSNATSILENLASPILLSGDWYIATLSATSRAGGWTASAPPRYNTNQMESAPGLSTQHSCEFQFEQGNVVNTGFTLSNYAAGNLTANWTSNVNGTGWVDSYEYGVGINFTETAQVQPKGSGHWGYYVELHGLVPASLYQLTAITAVAVGCLTYEARTGQTYSTWNNFALTEQDLPYDSISHAGGGAELIWNVPSNISKWGTFDNGTLYYTNQSNRSQAVVMPLQNLSEYGWGTSYVVELQGLGANYSYFAQVTLNYTATHSKQLLVFESRNLTFTYQLDSSGDGLTNAEKTYGWWVPVFYAPGALWGPGVYASGSWVTADPYDWATNGLVNDYVEKEFDLDPNTIDTAGSHMLDTWNLTFDMGSSDSCPSAYFQCWNESSKSTGTNPFNFAQYPGGPHTGKANATWSPPTRYPLDDGSQNDANHLWSSGTLSYLESLIVNEGVGWLRAVIGYYPTSGHYMLTVWGKLSWGANPLAASTPGTAITDGSRVNPLGGTDLQVNITSWADPGLASTTGVAAFIDATSVAGSVVDYANYTKQAAGNVGFTGPFVVTFPVSPLYQYATLNLSLEKNTGSFGQILNSPSLTVDLENRSLQYYNTSGNTLKFNYQVLPVFAKAPTYAFVPENNTTLSALPTGLQRYAGEQNFVLLVLNDTISGVNTISASAIHYTNNVSSGTYSVALSGGLNNILVPRAAFIDSPFGQMLLADNTTSSLPITSTGSNGAIQPEWSSAALNGVEWYDRAVGINSGSSYQPTNWKLNITSNTTTQNTTNTALEGGVPGNPALEQGYETRAIQAIVTLNISTPQDLQGILAGLLLNTTGGFTGWLFGATAALPTLDLLPAVTVALANSTFTNYGAYGAPVHTGSQSNPPSWWIFGASSWNLVSGIITGLKLISMVFSAAIAAMAYVAKLYLKVIQWGLQKLSQIPTFLREAQRAIASAWNALVTYIESQVKGFLTSTVQVNSWVTLLISPYVLPLGLVWAGAGHSLSSPGPGFSTFAFGGQLVGILANANHLLTIIEIALLVLDVLTFGVGTLVEFLIPLLVSLIMYALSATESGPLSQFSGSSQGTALWASTVKAAGTFFNLTASGLGKSFAGQSLADENTALSELTNYAGLASAFVLFLTAAGVMAAGQLSPNSMLSASGAAVGFLFAFSQILILTFIQMTQNPALKWGTPGAGALDLLGLSETGLGALTATSALLRDLEKPDNSVMIAVDSIAIALDGVAGLTGAVLLADNGM